MFEALDTLMFTAEYAADVFKVRAFVVAVELKVSVFGSLDLVPMCMEELDETASLLVDNTPGVALTSDFASVVIPTVLYATPLLLAFKLVQYFVPVVIAAFIVLLPVEGRFLVVVSNKVVNEELTGVRGVLLSLVAYVVRLVLACGIADIVDMPWDVIVALDTLRLKAEDEFDARGIVDGDRFNVVAEDETGALFVLV